MKPRILILTFILAAGAALAVSAQAAPAAKTGKLVRVSKQDAAWAAKARQNYPLTVCLTSDEALGSMGESAEYIYRVEGKPDELVVFCCDGCNEDFLKDPAPYLAKLEAAKAAKAAKAKAGTKKEEAGKGHH